MNRNTGMNAGQIIGTMNGMQVFGLDIAKHMFQLHTVNMGTGEIVNAQIKRAEAYEAYRRCRQQLSVVLGIRPAPQTQALVASLRNL
jgi:hypothetical protein